MTKPRMDSRAVDGRSRDAPGRAPPPERSMLRDPTRAAVWLPRDQQPFPRRPCMAEKKPPRGSWTGAAPGLRVRLSPPDAAPRSRPGRPQPSQGEVGGEARG